MELSHKLKLALFSTSSYSINLNNNFPLKDLLFISSDEEKEAILNFKIKTPNILGFFFLNMKAIHKILHEKDVVIKIDKRNFNEKFINNFFFNKINKR